MPRWSIPLLVVLVMAACGLGRTDVPVAAPAIPMVAEIEPSMPVAWPGDRLPGVPDRIDLTDVPLAFAAPPLEAPAQLTDVTAPADGDQPAGSAEGAATVVDDTPAAGSEADEATGDAPAVDDPATAAPFQPAPEAVPAIDPRAARSELTAAASRWIRRFEGRASRAYTDVRGNRTVGVGANLDAGDGPERLRALGVDYAAVREGDDQLDERQIDRLFARDLAAAVAAAERLVPDLHQHPLPVRLLVVDLIYTSGATGFTRFRLARGALAEHDYVALADRLCRTRWYRQTNGRAKAHVAELRAMLASQAE